MIITVASFKGGVGKTTTAVHLAHYLNKKAPTLLVDGDANSSALKWAESGLLEFKTVDERASARQIRQFENIVIDTQARPTRNDLKALADGCDLLIIPATPDALSLNALMLTIEELQNIKANGYRVLLTIIPPYPSTAGDDARATLKGGGLPVFKGQIRRFVAFQKAALEGVTVDAITDVHAGDGWEDYETIGRELTKL